MNIISRRALLASTAISVSFLTACDSSTESTEATREQIITTKPTHPARKWAHIGDSFTAGGLPEALAKLTKLEHMNTAMPGTTSLNAIVRSGLVNVKADIDLGHEILPYRVKLTNIRPTSPALANDRKMPVKLDGITGYIQARKADDYQMFHTESPALARLIEEKLTESLTITLDPEIPEQYQTKAFKENYSLIIELGRNDLDDSMGIENLIENIKKLLEHRAPGTDYFICDIPMWKNEILGTPERNLLNSWNNALEVEFGADKFIRAAEMLVSMHSESAKVAGIEFTEEDLNEINQGITPSSMTSDARGHYNEHGNAAWAHYVYKKISQS